MSKVIFKFDKEKDLWNIWETSNYEHPWENELERGSVLQRWKNRKFEECREEIEQYIQPLYSSGHLDIFLETLQNSWGKINNRFFERLEKITKHKIYSNEFNAYITTAGRCPYNVEEDSFMVSIRRPLLQNLRTCGHELMHLQMEKTHLPLIRNQLGFREIEYVNESLTAILNLECRDLWFVEDKGYAEHKELRKRVMETWKHNPDIIPLINECIEYVKRIKI